MPDFGGADLPASGRFELLSFLHSILVGFFGFFFLDEEYSFNRSIDLHSRLCERASENPQATGAGLKVKDDPKCSGC